ncbi:hypothetical protein JG688_00002109 [Phytophthora aleatoria]|uniref:Uncharacterized protein n=1 Tax=Phytophthora aleatoria TaxID=2496075 RepID=A0A8J5MB13_9STRA|nr:hypothetical protein JG688_00002109 [Phytophthora aleatoria]
MLEGPLVECASHRLNRAVSRCLGEGAEDLDSVQAVMVKPRLLHNSSKPGTYYDYFGR